MGRPANGKIFFFKKTPPKVRLQGLIAFCEEHTKTKAIVVSQDKRPRQLLIKDQLQINILPWKDFLTRLWAGEII